MVGTISNTGTCWDWSHIFFKKIYLILSTKVTNPFRKKGFIGKLVRKSNLKQLLKVRSLINNEVKINREVIK